jgi:Na+/melibiose symporter-like transporter
VFGLGSLLAGIVVSPRLSARYGKKNLFIWGLSLAALFTAVFLMLPPDAVVAAFGAEVLRQFAWGWTAPLLWAMMADVADYVEWKTGRRATAMVFAIMMVALKAGLAIGRSLASWMLSLYGYVPNVAQTEQAQLGIRLSASVVTAGVFALGVVCLLCYGINKEVNLRMAAELAERRRGYAG